MRRAKAREGEYKAALATDFYHELTWARTEIGRISVDKGLGGPEALNAVARLFAVAEPGSLIRKLRWPEVARMVAAGDFSGEMLKRPRWPNPAANETLIT